MIKSLMRICAAAATAALATARSIELPTPPSGLDLRQATDKYVFCHFMVGVVGSRSSAADYDDDMQRAKAAGIDAFALNIGTDDYTTDQLNYAYESAANNDMKVFISFDFNWFDPAADAAEVGQMIATFGALPAQLIVDEKVFASTFAGDGLDTAALRAAAGNTTVFWAPNFHPEEGTDLSVVDAAFNWVGWDNNGDNKAPDAGANVTVEDGDAIYLDALAAVGKSSSDYMAPISPWFFTHFGPEVDYSKNWVFPGDFLWYDSWQRILALQPRFLEIVTWNDYGESHYIGRLDSPHGDDGNSKWTYGYPHNGWLTMAEPFIAAYKAGATDAAEFVAEDKIVYWFRPTMKALDCDATDTTMEPANNETGNYFMGRPDGYETMEDKVFVVTMLTEAGSLTVTSGSGAHSMTVDAPAGLAKFSLDMSPGDVTLALTRADGTVSLEGTAPMPVLDSCPCGIYNFNAYVGELPEGEADEMLPEGYAQIMNGLKVDSCGPSSA